MKSVLTHSGGTFMKSSSRLRGISRFTVSLLFILPAISAAQTQRAPILEKVAKTYGIDSWDQVESIRYTWNADIPGLFKAAHKWEWEPKTGKVTFEGTDKDGKAVKGGKAGKASAGPSGAAPKQAIERHSTRKAAAVSGDDDDFSEIEKILRNRGIS